VFFNLLRFTAPLRAKNDYLCTKKLLKMSPKCHVSFFASIFELNLTINTVENAMFSVKWNLSRHTDPSQCHQMTHGGGGSKIGQKSVTYYLNGSIVENDRRIKNNQLIFEEVTMVTYITFFGFKLRWTLNRQCIVVNTFYNTM